MIKLFILVLFSLPIAAPGQSTFSFGAAPRQQYYPANGGYPMQGVPYGYAPVQRAPMNPGNGNNIGNIIGLVGGITQMVLAAEQQKRIQQMQQKAMANYNTGADSLNEYFNRNYTKPVATSQQTYSAPQAASTEHVPEYTRSEKTPLPEGIRISSDTVKSPYSNYTINTEQIKALKPGSIHTDFSIKPKKNFIIPAELPFNAYED